MHAFFRQKKFAIKGGVEYYVVKRDVVGSGAISINLNFELTPFSLVNRNRSNAENFYRFGLSIMSNVETTSITSEMEMDNKDRSQILGSFS
ncbi:MAG TPA: hypothetical protein DCP28_35975 [Cytophagales bacterium]|nr:hypothetical protein [Cytophagales bacterium]